MNCQLFTSCSSVTVFATPGLINSALCEQNLTWASENVEWSWFQSGMAPFTPSNTLDIPVCQRVLYVGGPRLKTQTLASHIFTHNCIQKYTIANIPLPMCFFYGQFRSVTVMAEQQFEEKKLLSKLIKVCKEELVTWNKTHGTAITPLSHMVYHSTVMQEH